MFVCRMKLWNRNICKNKNWMRNLSKKSQGINIIKLGSWNGIDILKGSIISTEIEFYVYALSQAFELNFPSMSWDINHQEEQEVPWDVALIRNRRKKQTTIWKRRKKKKSEVKEAQNQPTLPRGGVEACWHMASSFKP